MDDATNKDIRMAINKIAERIYDSAMYGDNDKTGLMLPLWIIKLCKTGLEQLQLHEQWEIEIRNTREKEADWAQDRFDLLQEIDDLKTRLRDVIAQTAD